MYLIKLAHQFWISYPPPGAGGSTTSKDKQSQLEEEKQRGSNRERQLDYDAVIKVQICINNIQRDV